MLTITPKSENEFVIDCTIPIQYRDTVTVVLQLEPDQRISAIVDTVATGIDQIVRMKLRAEFKKLMEGTDDAKIQN